MVKLSFSSSRRRLGNSCLKSLQGNCTLIVIGVLIVCSMIITLSIGHYHHDRNEVFSIASSSLQSKLQDFLGEETVAGGMSKNIIGTVASERVIQEVGGLRRPRQVPKTSGAMGARRGTGSSPGSKKSRKSGGAGSEESHERSIFESIIKRVKWTEEQCNSTPNNERNTINKSLKAKSATDLLMLPEGGVAFTLERWLNENPTSNNKYPTCYLPPPKSCDVTTYTLIVMSHTTERLQTFMDPLGSMVDSWPGLTEIIIVWNSPRIALTQVANDGNQREYAAKLLQWHRDTAHPLRIFFSLENGLNNNLLNRYHPKLTPQNEAVMYFDDDGPFFSREAMVYGGFELWKRNSNVQVGCFPRNVRFLSDRMKQLEKTNLHQNIEIMIKDAHGYIGESHPTFTPVCRNVTGDHVEYNYFSFPDFAGHVLLPSGTFLHRNFLCFIWHPAFEELRKWVVAHKTMPDDMTVSTLISHLSGRAPRTFPREISFNSRRLTVDHSFLESPQPNQSHRRLLWKQKHWGAWREEAINSILGYFGSIHPGTVGWCANTPYVKERKRGVPFVCHPEKPSLNMLPWLTEGGIGSTQCPFDPNIVKQALDVAKTADPILAFNDLCVECKYKNVGITCRERVQFLIDRYNMDLTEAKAAVMKEDTKCQKK